MPKDSRTETRDARSVITGRMIEPQNLLVTSFSSCSKEEIVHKSMPSGVQFFSRSHQIDSNTVSDI